MFVIPLLCLALTTVSEQCPATLTTFIDPGSGIPFNPTSVPANPVVNVPAVITTASPAATLVGPTAPTSLLVMTTVTFGPTSPTIGTVITTAGMTTTGAMTTTTTPCACQNLAAPTRIDVPQAPPTIGMVMNCRLTVTCTPQAPSTIVSVSFNGNTFANTPASNPNVAMLTCATSATGATWQFNGMNVVDVSCVGGNP